MRKIIFILFLIFSNVQFVYASDLSIKNAGFVPANIWYSKDPFFAGEKIRIYTIIFNGSSYDIVGTVEFLDNDITVGKTNFSLSGGGRVQDVWVDWKGTLGKHTITARITGATASLAGGAKRPIVLDNIETGKSERDIDLDTDGDGIGNKDDLDDDNDGVPDVEELRNGTNPLKKDTDGNGISDGKELEIALKQNVAAEKLVANSKAPSGTIAGTIKKVEENIPVSVKTGVTIAANALERFRVGEGYQVQLAREEKQRDIQALKENSTSVQKEGTVLGSISNTAEKPFAYVMLGILTLLQYFFQWQIVFYGVLLYLSYRFIRWGVRRVRNQ